VALHEQKHGAVTVLRPDVPLVGKDADRFKSRFGELLGESLGRCAVDASQIPYVDSRGLEVLVELNDELAQSGQALKLCGLNETVRKVLELTGLSGRFEHFADVNAAVRSFL